MKRSRINPISKKRRGKVSTRLCAYCAKVFDAANNELRRGGGRFCSATCWYASQRARGKTLRVCRVCNKTFENKNPLRYCSRACFIEQSRQRKIRICASCGVEFTTRIPSISQKYCSKNCQGVSQQKTLIVPCVHCGVDIRGHGVTRPRKYCSKACQHAHVQGINHSLFRGGGNHHRGAGWAGAKRIVRDRDKTCVSCGAEPVEKQQLSVDHIIPYRLVKKYAEEMPLGPSPNDPLNLVGLCRKDHSRKTRIEQRLLDGDLIGFVAEVKRIIPLERVEAALRLWGLSFMARFEHGGGKVVPAK